jgi:transposase InsO family protein
MRRLAAKEKLIDLCREYGISRKTAWKFKKRFTSLGISGLEDQSRAPRVIPHKTPPELEELIVAERKKHTTWGPKKLKEVLEGQLGRGLPSASTIGGILVRRGLVERRVSRTRHEARPTGLREAKAPNDVWCIDYKGQFRLGDRSYCYPLTLTDQFSRYILGCEGMAAISDEAARDVCADVFRTYGLPTAMRSDNGTPFASTGLAGLTRLSVFWLRLGIVPERIKPAHPEQNGRHERMHRTLKAETTRPARSNLLQQQERFDEFVEEFNFKRPHEAIGMKRPAQVFKPSKRPYPAKLPDFEYPTHDDSIRVSKHGFVRITSRYAYVTTALAGEYVGVREELDGRWLVSYSTLDLGYVGTDHKFAPITNSVPPGGN